MGGEGWILLIITLLLLTWYSVSQARERAVQAARRACREGGVVLLDDTVTLARLRLRRRGDGRVALLRRYHFEFTREGEWRRGGMVELLGPVVIATRLEEEGAIYEGEGG